MTNKPNRRSKGLSVYANLTAHRRSKADAKARQKAEYLASLPKHPIKRLLYRLHPKRVIKFWFSKRGAIMLLKLAGIGLVIVAILIAALFAYYRKELDSLNPSELAKRVQTTVTRYLDRNGTLLWEDKGLGNYTLVIDDSQIPKYMKEATVAVEDKDFYKHGGISVSGIIRAGLSDVGGGEVQGASTLTQQLIRLVYLQSDFSQNRLSVSRKIKEIILAIEADRMYSKDQILDMYLNTAPFGGRRNGIEAAALTYFGKHAKDLDLAESALLASIPKDPTNYNPYNLDYNKSLIDRQHLVIDDMQQQGYITAAQATAAKNEPILDTIKPEVSATDDIKAPWFVLEVQKQLEQEFGTQLVRGGGLTVKTTLDYRIEQKAEQEVANNYKYVTPMGANNLAYSAVDVPTGQVLAMVGSYNFNDPNFGSVNAATSLLQPGSSIKPFVYANLFKPQQGQNYGAGSILNDGNIDKLYGGTLRNYDGSFFGPITIRQALANSRNPPAVEAGYIGGIDKAVQTARDAGDSSYCVGIQYGLSAAIGSCSVKQIEHTNAYATLARQGLYKPLAYVLQVTNAQGQTIKQWKDDQAKQVIDPQITYILSDILSDDSARSRVFGRNALGMVIPGVKTATKTGTTDDGNGHVKDDWMMSYTPRIAMGSWMGRSDGKPLKGLSDVAIGHITNDMMQYASQQIYQKDGTWKPGDWFQRPAGVQTLTVDGHTDLFPSWYTKPAAASNSQVTFDSVSKKKATSCTPDRAKVVLTVQTYTDPATKQTTVTPPDGGYDPNSDDNVHNCSDAKPFASVSASPTSGKTYHITASVNQGTFPLSSVQIAVNGQVISNQPISGPGDYSVDYTFSSGGSNTVSATVIDQALYDASASQAVNVVGFQQNPILPNGRRQRGNG